MMMVGVVEVLVLKVEVFTSSEVVCIGAWLPRASAVLGRGEIEDREAGFFVWNLLDFDTTLGRFGNAISSRSRVSVVLLESVFGFWMLADGQIDFLVLAIPEGLGGLKNVLDPDL